MVDFKSVNVLNRLKRNVASCEACRLCETREKTVFGVGSHKARLMFIGEGPGANEDKTGEPFVGRAGRLLDKMIVAMGLTRERVYITNIVKCRPPKNRDPKSDEIEACNKYLVEQIETIQPEAIVTLGKPASQTILGSDLSIGQLRRHRGKYLGIPVFPVYHPAYLLRNSAAKKDAWTDLKRVIAFLEI